MKKSKMDIAHDGAVKRYSDLTGREEAVAWIFFEKGARALLRYAHTKAHLTYGEGSFVNITDLEKWVKGE